MPSWPTPGASVHFAWQTLEERILELRLVRRGLEERVRTSQDVRVRIKRP